MALEGGCYCGEVRYAVQGEPMMQAQCHCRECQHITGGAANMLMAFTRGAMTYTKGAPKTFTRADIEGAVTREFCATCGSHMATKPQGFPVDIVKVGTLDDPSVFKPTLAMQMADAHPFHAVPEGIAVFDRFPG